jgi:hypothetical protein
MEHLIDKYMPADPTLVDIANPGSLQFWAGTLQTDEAKIRDAVAKVGTSLEAVKEELGIGGA